MKSIASTPRPPWWQGPRGEWYVVAQTVLLALLLFGPRTFLGWPPWAYPFTALAAVGSVILLLLGLFLAGGGMLALGANLTPLPCPKEQATLVETGLYRLVRHPIYSGVICLALGWALWVQGWLTIAYAILLFVFFDCKSRREERWLLEKFAGYAAYRQRVRKLIPFIY